MELFIKLRMQSFAKINPRELAKSLCRSLMKLNLVPSPRILSVAYTSFNAIRKIEFSQKFTNLQYPADFKAGNIFRTTNIGRIRVNLKNEIYILYF